MKQHTSARASRFQTKKGRSAAPVFVAVGLIMKVYFRDRSLTQRHGHGHGQIAKKEDNKCSGKKEYFAGTGCNRIFDP